MGFLNPLYLLITYYLLLITYYLLLITYYLLLIISQLPIFQISLNAVGEAILVFLSKLILRPSFLF